MLELKSLSNLIEHKVSPGMENDRGWRPLRCACCNDYQERGGFRFDAETVGYYCWNCGTKAVYEEGSGKFSKSMRYVLESFGVTRDDLAEISASVFLNRETLEKQKQDQEITLKKLSEVKLFTPEVSLPPSCFPLGHHAHDEFQEPIIEYLLNRKIDPLKHNIHFSMDKRYLRRAIIPFMRNGKVIYWQARAIDKDTKPRYLNCNAARDAVLYGYDNLTKWSELPLFITEGVFDALCVDGICLLGSSLNQAKIEVLKKTRRRIVFVLDSDAPGEALGSSVIDNEWEFTMVDNEASDINDSIMKFGKTYTTFCLMKNIQKAKGNKVEAKLNLELSMMINRMKK
jgi:hypothetical protein